MIELYDNLYDKIRISLLIIGVPISMIGACISGMYNKNELIIVGVSMLLISLAMEIGNLLKLIWVGV